MEAAELFREQLPLIDRIAVRLCRRAGLSDADAEDFASDVKVAMIESDYAALRAFEERSSVATYLTVVMQRMLFDQRIHDTGRWHPSAEARRLGAAAVLVETLVLRDRRPLDEVLPLARGLEPELTRAGLEALVARLPQRAPRMRAVVLEDDGVAVAAPDTADARALARDASRTAARAAHAIRAAMESWPPEDRVLIRLRFGSNVSIADVSRMLRVPQRPLYRRQEALLARLRKALEAASIDAATLFDALETIDAPDLGLGKPEPPRQSKSEGESRT
ncbi:MAG: sigma-70 family RNA polymerase sigma factor [Acidobacteria bacterium]|nr:sigma-70 family RNA polymerase sigma factor [Acidobacteriota bacterium]MBV9476592.1 sigma-70 family RNA polymerase sigma factor [Acidobacteriota bacterium]